MNQPLSDLDRRLHNLASYGTIAEVDHAGGRVRVNINGRLSGWLPQPQAIGNNFRIHAPLRVGTQVLVTSPSGDPANGVIAQILNSDALPPPGDSGDADVIVFDDGTIVRYDSAAHALDIDVMAAGKATVRVGAASIVTDNDGLVLSVGGTSLRLSAAGIQYTAPAIGMTVTGGGVATLSGNFEMQGRLGVTGDVVASGSVMDAGGNSNHHTH